MSKYYYMGTIRFLKSIAVVVRRRILGLIFAPIPIHWWPTWIGNVFDIKVPSNVERKHLVSPSGGANINIVLVLIDRTAGICGDIAECGVFKGATLLPIGLYLRQKGITKRIIGLDSFEGFDGTVAIDIELGGAADLEKRPGGFNQTSFEYVTERIAALWLQNRIKLVKGFFADTLPTLPEAKYSFVHLDCDIYNSYKQCLAYFYERMTPGGIILFDEYNDPPWPGCNKAVDEFLADRKEKPQLIEEDGYEKFFVIKE